MSENLGYLHDRINVPNSDCEDIGTNSVVMLDLERHIKLKDHRVIVFYRIRNKDFRKLVRQVYLSTINMEDVHLKSTDKSLKFSYIGNLQIVLEPDIKVFKYADPLGVKEILAL